MVPGRHAHGLRYPCVRLAKPMVTNPQLQGPGGRWIARMDAVTRLNGVNDSPPKANEQTTLPSLLTTIISCHCPATLCFL